MTDEPESSQESSEAPEVAAVPQTPPPEDTDPKTVETEPKKDTDLKTVETDLEQAIATVTAAADESASVRPFCRAATIWEVTFPVRDRSPIRKVRP